MCTHSDATVPSNPAPVITSYLLDAVDLLSAEIDMTLSACLVAHSQIGLSRLPPGARTRSVAKHVAAPIFPSSSI